MKSEKKLNRPNLYDYLKVLALVTMLIDHIGYYLYPQYERLRLIWRIAFPIFLFLVGFSGSYKWRRDIPLIWFFLWWFMKLSCKYFWIWMDVNLNILIAITLSRWCLFIIDKYRKPRVIISFCITFLLLHTQLRPILEYWSLSFFFALWWRSARYYKQYFHLWIFAFLGLFIYSIYVFKFWYIEGNTLMADILITLFFIVYLLFFALSKENIPLHINKWWDKFILWFSKHALAFYVIHIVILYFLCLYKFGFLNKIFS